MDGLYVAASLVVMFWAALEVAEVCIQPRYGWLRRVGGALAPCLLFVGVGIELAVAPRPEPGLIYAARIGLAGWFGAPVVEDLSRKRRALRRLIRLLDLASDRDPEDDAEERL